MFHRYFLVLIIILQISLIEGVDEIIQPKCDGNNIYYSIVVNMKEFLENDKNLDGREIYKTKDDLKTKRIGVLKGSAYDNTFFENAKEYDKLYDLLNDLMTYKIDAIIVDNLISNYTKAFDLYVSLLDANAGMSMLAFPFQKDNDTFINRFNEHLANAGIGIKKNSLGFDDENVAINLKGENGIMNVGYRVNIPPYAYKLNGEVLGNEITLIGGFAEKYGYKINLIELETIQEIIDCVQKKECDFGGGLFPMLDEYKDIINYSNIFHPSQSGISVRYENTVEGSEESIIYDTIRDFDGQILGSLSGSYYYDMTKKNFPNSEIIKFDDFYDLYTSLLLEDIEGFIIDKPISDYFSNRYPERITFYEDILDKNNYGFGFQKNQEGEVLLKEFNQFLSEIDLDDLYYKWTHNKTIDIYIDTNLNSEKTINVAINMDFIPLCFYIFQTPRGYEYELVYLFAKKYNYNINFINLENDSERMSYLIEGKANITGGHFTITDERKKTIHFSEPILKTSTIFSVRTDGKKEFLSNIVLDKNYEPKPNNNVDIEVKFSNITKNASCVFPTKFNNTIIINCTIANITETNPYFEGFEYGNSNDKIRFVYYSFNATTLFNANKFLPNHTIIKESNKNEKICKIEKTGGLSTMATAAIIIFSLIALFSAIIAYLLK